jgi:hypothetical protein
MPARPLGLRVASALGAMALVAMGSVLVGSASDSSLATLMVLVLEPLLWAALILAATYALVGRKPLPAAVALFGLVSLAWGLRRDPPKLEPPHVSELASPWMRRCAFESAPAPRPLRVVSWTVDEDLEPARALELVRGLEADVVVLQGVHGALVDELALKLEADAVHVQVGRRGHAVLALEGLHDCGPERVYPVELPALGERQARASLSFPRVDGQSVPLLVVQADRARLGELGHWPDLLDATGLTLAGLGRGLASETLLVVGDTETLSTFHRFHAQLASVGLQAAPARPTWPAQVGPLPVPPLYPPERLWFGSSWQIQRVGTERLEGSHLALVVDLLPSGA